MIRPKLWRVLDAALEDGCGHAAREALECVCLMQEHGQEPTQQQLADIIEREVSTALHEWFEVGE